METEEWRTCIYNEETFDSYEVSTLGNVRNKKTKQIKKPLEHSGGYLQLKLWHIDRYKTLYIHRLVGFTWIPNDNPTIKTEIHHINHNKHDNRVENLMWIDRETHSQNKEINEERRKAREGKGKRVRCVETGEIFDTIGQASEKIKRDRSSIGRCCKSGKTCGGFHWEYID